MSNTKIINQKEYLKKYLNIGKDKDKKKKKKNKTKTIQNRLRIIDDNIDVINDSETLTQNELDEILTQEDAPQVVGVVDDRPLALRLDDYRKNSKWKLVGSDDESKPSTSNNSNHNSRSNSHQDFSPKRSKKSYDSDESPPRKRNKNSDSDPSPPRKIKSERKSPDSDASPPRRNRTVDVSPQRIKKERHSDSDPSPPRKYSKCSPPHKSRSEDSSPRRKNKNYDSDASPPRKNSNRSPPRKNRSEDSSPRRKNKNYDSDASPPRKYSNSSPPRKNRSADSSPPRKNKNYDSDASPPRKNSNRSPPRKNRNADSSPPRKNKNYDSEASPPRKNSNRSTDLSPCRRKFSEDSPPRKYKRHSSPPRKSEKHKLEHKKSNTSRKSRWGEWGPEKQNSDTDLTPPRKKSDDKNKSKHTKSIDYAEPGTSKMQKTLDGKAAGLQNAKDLKHETQAFKQREEVLFKKMSQEVSGINAAPVIRDRKTGKQRDFEQEAMEEFAKLKRDKEQKEKYDRWGKGLKQVENIREKIESDLHEMSKPLARYADDEDLERHLKEQERDGDPMLAYFRKKRKQQAVVEGRPEKPMYDGEFMPNRFGVPPGHRWDGVDRSNGYEKQWFSKQNAKKAMEEEIYKWSTEDM